MLKTIKLYGDLKEITGHSELDAHINSVGDCIRFLLMNWPQLEAHMNTRHYQVLTDGNDIGEEEIHYPVAEEIKIVPVIAGAGGSTGRILIGAALIGIAIAAPGASFGASGVLGFGANMLSGPIQMANDRQYKQFTNALKKKNMFLGSGVDSSYGNFNFASFSPSYKQALAKANFYNDKLGNIGTNTNIKIPGTAKSVAGIINQYVPTGVGADKDKNNVQYHTSTGGYYNGNGDFITGYGQQVAFGSLQDAVDTIFAAAQSGNVSTVPDKFLTPEYIKTIKKLIKRGDFTQDQGNDIITAINEINTIDKPKTKTKKKKDYGPTYNTGGNDGMSQSDNNNNVFVPYSGGSNLYQGNTAYGDADDYTDDSSGV